MARTGQRGSLISGLFSLYLISRRRIEDKLRVATRVRFPSWTGGRMKGRDGEGREGGDLLTPPLRNTVYLRREGRRMW